MSCDLQDGVTESVRSRLDHTIASYMAYRSLNGRKSPQGDILLSQKLNDGFEIDLDRVSGPLNCVSMLAKRTEVTNCEEQYNRFRSFICSMTSAGNVRVKLELKHLLYPAFINIAIEMCCKNAWSNANSFVNKHKEDHDSTNILTNDITRLLELINLQNLDANGLVKETRELKSKINLSHNAYSRLQQYLRHGNQILLLQILNRYVSVDLTENPWERSKICETKSKSKTNPKTDFNILDSDMIDKDLVDFQTAVKDLSHLPQPSISICLYSVADASKELTSFKFARSCHSLYTGSNDGSISVWSLLPNSYQKQVPGSNSRSADKGASKLLGHSGMVTGISPLHDKRFLLSSSEDTSVRLWDLKTNTNVVSYDGHSYPVWDIDSNVSDGYFCSCSEDHTARLWNTEYAFPLRIFSGHTDGVDCVKFHPNGKFIGTGSSDNSCRLWDVNSGQFVRVFVGHKAPPMVLAFSPDGKFMASGGEDRIITLWDIGSGNLIKQLEGHTDSIYSLQFSLDGTILASGSRDHSIRIWPIMECNGINQITKLQTRADDQGGKYSTKNTSIFDLKFSEGNVLSAVGSC